MLRSETVVHRSRQASIRCRTRRPVSLTGIDRLILAGSKWYAWDSSSGTLYRFIRQRSSVVAKNIGAKRFAVTADGISIWDEAVRRLQKRGIDE
jgi:hypothetical protein